MKKVEDLAAYMHETWSKWFKHQSKCEAEFWNGGKNADSLHRWNVQADTPYEELSEKDKEKDRKFAREILEILGINNEEYVPGCRGCKHFGLGYDRIKAESIPRCKLEDGGDWKKARPLEIDEINKGCDEYDGPGPVTCEDCEHWVPSCMLGFGSTKGIIKETFRRMRHITPCLGDHFKEAED